MAEGKQWSCEISRTLDLQIGKEGFTAVPPVTVGQLFRATKERFPSNEALAYKEGESWKKINYTAYYDLCVRAAKSFLKVKKERVVHALCMESCKRMINAPVFLPRWCSTETSYYNVQCIMNSHFYNKCSVVVLVLVVVSTAWSGTSALCCYYRVQCSSVADC